MFDFLISVTEYDIKHSEPGSIAFNAVAVAIDNSISGAYAMVDQNTKEIIARIKGKRQVFELDHYLQEWIKRDSSGEGVLQPFKFRLVQLKDGDNIAYVHIGEKAYV